MILRAPIVVPVEAPPIHDGMVRIDGPRITHVGPWQPSMVAGEEVIDLAAQGYELLLPGLINAHCHLDYTMMRGAIPPQESFGRWVGEINTLKRRYTPEDYRTAIADGFRELRRWGTTSVCNIAAFPELLPTLPPDPLRTWWCPELIDIRTPGRAPEAVAQALSALGSRPHGGLSPHAPYTASAPLYHAAQAAAATRPGLVLTTHLAESADEDAMFRDNAGPFARFLESVGRPMDDCGHGSPLANALGRGLIGPGWLTVHVNGLDAADLALLTRAIGESGQPWYIVHCPCSHAWFGHPPFPWEALARAGATILIGSDSLASNHALNLFDELQMAQKTVPGLTSHALLRTVTSDAARALGLDGELGVIAPGALADLIALPPHPSEPDDLYQRIIANRHPDPWMLIDGTPIAPSA